MGCISSYKAALYAHSKGVLKLNIGPKTAKWAEENGYNKKVSLLKVLKGQGHWMTQFIEVALSTKEKFIHAYKHSGADFMVFDEKTNKEIMEQGLNTPIGEH